MRSISRTRGAACAAAASAAIALWVNSFFVMALKPIWSFKKNREGKVKSVFNLNITSRQGGGVCVEKALVRFEALEEFLKKKISSSVLIFFI